MATKSTYAKGIILTSYNEVKNPVNKQNSMKMK